MNPAPAPDHTSLQQFLLGTLPADQLAAVEKWLAADPSAAARLAELRPRDPVTDVLDSRALADTSDSNLTETIPQVVPPAVPVECVGPYRIVRELGRGGMGVVYEAQDPYLPRRVAVKVIGADAARDARVRARFRAEAEAVSRIDHPNVVPVYAFGEDAGRPFLVMPLLAGETLAERLTRGPLTQAELVRAGRDIASALEAAHAAGLIHRDIKPGNVWLDAGTGRARVLDFGLAKSQDAPTHTETGAIMGSAHYMSPQQASGQPLDARTDLFSLGALLYHAATGRRPFDGETVYAVLKAVVEATPAEPVGVPPHVAKLIRRLLEKEPAARPASATEVLIELSDPVPVPPKRRFPVRALAAGLLLALAAGAIVYEVKFGNGTLVVDATPEADVRLKNGSIEVYDKDGKLKYTIAPGARAADVARGTYKLKVVGADGVELDADEFTMKRNGKAVVRVTAKADPPPVAVKDADRRAAEWVLSVGGQILVWNGAEHRWIDTVAALPRDPFPQWAPRFKNLSEVTDDKLVVFKDCTRVKQIDLPHTPVTDAGLAHFARCKELEYISLNGKGITDNGLAHLAGLSKLTDIQLRGTRVTDAGLVHFGSCKRLQYLDLANTKVTDTGLAHFRECVELERVLLEGTTVTDAGLAQLAACRELHVLGIADTRTTSAALKPFAKCNFTDLNVTGTAFDDTGFAHLANSTRLQNLVLQKTQVTAAGVAAFARTRPNCRIVWDGGTIAPASAPSPAGTLGRAEFPTYTRIAQIGTHDRRHRASIEHLDAAPQWDRIATVAPDGLKVWELDTLKLIAEVPRLDEKQPLPLACVLVGPSAVAVLDREGESGLTIYDVSQKPAKVLRRLPLARTNFARDLVAAPNREWVAFAHDEQVELWKPADLLAESGKPAHRISGEPTDREFGWRRDALRFSADGSRFAFKVADAVRTFARTEGRWAEAALVPAPGSCVSFDFGRRAETLLVSHPGEANKGHVCAEWDVTAKQPKRLAVRPVPNNGVSVLSVLDDGRLLFANLEPHTLPLPLRADDRADRLTVPFRYAGSFELRPAGGNTFVARDGPQVRRFRLQGGKLEADAAEAHDQNEFGRAGGGDAVPHFAAGRVALVAATPELPVRVFGLDGPRPELLFEVPTPAKGARQVVLSPNGKEVFVGGDNEIPQIWAVGPGREPLVRFWNSARGHAPLGLSDDGKFALTRKGRAVYVWDREDTNQPIFEHKLADTQWPTRARPRPGGWLVPVLEFNPAQVLIPLAIDTNNGKPAARAGAPFACAGGDCSAPANALIGLRHEKQKIENWRIALADLEKNPVAEREVRLPIVLQQRYTHFRSASLSPDRTRAAVLSLDDRTGYVGFVALVDLNAGKLVWEHNFGGEVVYAECTTGDRLALLFRNGAIEVVEPKIAAHK